VKSLNFIVVLLISDGSNAQQPLFRETLVLNFYLFLVKKSLRIVSMYGNVTVKSPVQLLYANIYIFLRRLSKAGHWWGPVVPSTQESEVGRWLEASLSSIVRGSQNKTKQLGGSRL
jgi:hypothetical protein